MAIDNFTARGTAFRTTFEAEGDFADPDRAALLIDPAAPPLAIVAAAQARALTLARMLELLQASNSNSATPDEIATVLAPSVQEIELLLNELGRRIGNDAEGAGHRPLRPPQPDHPHPQGDERESC